MKREPNYQKICESLEKQTVDLPLSDPPLKYLNRFYVPLGIAFNNKNAKVWFHSSHIQTKRLKRQNIWMVLYNEIPFVRTLRFTLRGVRRIGANFLIRRMLILLQKGYYISIELDWNTLRWPEAPTDLFSHDTIITGYDAEKREFLLNGYNPLRKGLSKAPISWDLFLKSFYKLKRSKVELHREKPSKKTFSFSSFQKGIKNYARSTITPSYLLSEKTVVFPHNEDYGMEATYNYIERQLRSRPVSADTVDSTILRVKGMEEWAHAMIARMRYLKGHYDTLNVDAAIEGYTDVAKKFRTMYILMLKYLIDGKTDDIESVEKTVAECRAKEKEILESLIRQF